MSGRPEGVVVRMLRWIDSAISRLLKRIRQTAATQLSMGRIVATLERIDARLERTRSPCIIKGVMIQ